MEERISMLPSFARQSAPEKHAHGIGLTMQSPRLAVSVWDILLLNANFAKARISETRPLVAGRCQGFSETARLKVPPIVQFAG